MKALIWGHFLLAIMGVVYCIAWALDFSNEGFMDLWYSKLLYYISITGTTIGFILIMEATRIMFMDLRGLKVKIWHIAVLGLIVYIIAFILTTPWYKRIFTAELFLLMLWAVLQSAVFIGCYYQGMLTRKLTVTSFILLVVGTLLGLVFYNYYYSYTGFTQLNLGIYPYGILIVLGAIIAIFLRWSKKTDIRYISDRDPFRWERDFKKTNRDTFVIWMGLGIIISIPGWLYLIFHSYRGDMIACQYMLGGLMGFFMFYLPSLQHHPIPEHREHITKVVSENVSKQDVEDLKNRLVRGLKKKGFGSRVYSDQLFLSDIKMSQMHVIEIRNEEMLIMVREMNSWPNPFRKKLMVSWTPRTDSNRKISGAVEDLISS